jgi:hypothetical protein
VVDKIQFQFFQCRVSSLVRLLAFGDYSFGFSLGALKYITTHFSADPGTLFYIAQILIRSADSVTKKGLLDSGVLDLISALLGGLDDPDSSNISLHILVPAFRL